MATLETTKSPKKKQKHLLWSKLLQKLHEENYLWNKVTEEVSKLGCLNHSLANKAEAHSLIPITHDQQEDRRGLKCVPAMKEGHTMDRCWIFNQHLKPMCSQ